MLIDLLIQQGMLNGFFVRMKNIKVTFQKQDMDSASVEELAQTANFLDPNAGKLKNVMSFFKVA
ncbi:MAG TPA: hypothetical protein VHO90_04825 [Bacteroidales bacterium]|nr:hypothetical protein [Bacteroidales bacterium]